jgi:putative endopeptidase
MKTVLSASKVTGALLLGLTCLLAGPAPAQAQPPKSSGIDLASLDRSVKPCEDFYSFANGGWLKTHPIPGDKPRWGTFNILADANLAVLHSLLETMSVEKASHGSPDQKLGDFYRLGMDTARLDQQKLEPLQKDLHLIAEANGPDQLRAVIVHLHSQGVHPFFDFSATQDAKNSEKVIGQISQGGLGLPDRDYYLRTDEKSQKLLSQYRAHLVANFALLGATPEQSQKQADQVLGLEKAMASASLTKVQMRDPVTTYHPTTVDDLATSLPHFRWAAYFQEMGAPPMATLNNATPSYFKELDALLASTDPAVLKSYLQWTLLRTSADYLSQPIVELHYEFYGKTLTGTPKQSPRWQRVVRTIDRCLGEALGQKYVEKTFPPEAKKQIQDLIHNLEAVLKEDIGKLSWMGPATKQEALAKLAGLHLKIGYPDRWRDYSALDVEPDSYLANVRRSEAFEVRRDLNKIGKPQDHSEWYMTPPTVNAYYDPQNNEIVFPAGILQPPFFSPNVDAAVNYGGIGTVIGHEITHGFDDEGRQYDDKGNLRDWWTATDLANFTRLATAVSDQFSGYTISKGLKINGKLVLGESLADLGGLHLSYQAYERSLQGKPRETLDGFTPEQRFFLGYARVWATNLRPEYERLQVNTDPHPHPKYRVNGPLSNMEEFTTAFHCKPGCAMVRPVRNRIW